MQLHRALAKLHNTVDKTVSAILAKERDVHRLRSSCRAGCSACCRLLPTVTLADAVAVLCALRKTHPDEIARIQEECTAISKDLVAKKLTAAQYRDTETDCPVLKDSRCLAYDSRPVVCRAHHSFDEAWKCGAKETYPIKQLPAAKISAPFWGLASDILRASGLPNSIGPLPYMLLVAMYVEKSGDDWRELSTESCFNFFGKSLAAWLFIESDMEDYDSSLKLLRDMGVDVIPEPYPIWELL
jgi:Fe-S-cluster containining protein